MSRAPETIGDLVRELDAAIGRMSKSNPHRSLLIRVGNALVSVAQKNVMLESLQPAPATAPAPEVTA